MSDDYFAAAFANDHPNSYAAIVILTRAAAYAEHDGLLRLCHVILHLKRTGDVVNRSEGHTK